jgi:endonuclease-8
MPEGDTIFRAARTLHRALAGRVVTRFESVYPQLTRVQDDTPITGRIVDRVTARGKHCLLYFSGDLILRTHMRMSGSWHLYRPGEPWQRPARDLRILVATDAFLAVGFSIPVVEFETVRTIERQEALGQLGPDLLAPEVDEAAVVARWRRRAHLEIAEALLDQRAAAGIGNVYKSELLFLCGVPPFAAVREVTDGQLACLVATARRLLRANVADTSPGAIVTYAGLRRTTGRANPADRLWVYGRAGEPCRRCAAPIQSRKQGKDARTTYWCPQCQGTPVSEVPGSSPGWI